MPRSKKRKLHESDIKVALLNWYRKEGKLKDACIVSEMVVANWRHRIDLVIVNDEVNAYEIKSDFDNLKRLRSQMRAFSPRFDKLAVICPPKFTEEVIKLVPKGVGVIEYSAGDQDVSFQLIHPYPEIPIADKAKFISILNKRQLAKFLRSRGRKFSGSKSKAFLANLATELSWDELRGAVAKVLKIRYSKASKIFLDSLQENKPITSDDLSKLVKWKIFRWSRKYKEEEIEF